MLTTEQLFTLKAAIAADPDPAVAAAVASNNDTELARLYNANSLFVVWKPDTRKSDIFGATTWKNFTPVDSVPAAAIPATPTEAEKFALQVHMARTLVCQSSQFNMQTLLISPGDTLNMALANIRNGIKDSVQNLPSGASGALLDAGWAAIKDVSIRFVNKVEQVFANGTGTTGTPGFLTYTGQVTIDDLGRMRSL